MPRRPRPTPCHARQEAGEGGRVDRLDLVAQRGERTAAQDAQHVRVAPLAFESARAELAEHDPPVGLEPGRARRGPRSTEMPKRAHSSSIVNGHVRARVARHEVVERAIDRIGERRGQTLRDRPPERVAQPRRVLGGRERAADLDHAAFGAQLRRATARVGPCTGRAPRRG